MPDVEGRWVPWQRQFFRVNQEWVKTNRLGVRAGTVPRGAAGQWKDKLVPPQELPEEWPKPEVLLQDLTTGGWKREPLAKTWARFFPDVPPSERETYAYPLPGTAEFWRLYAEPVYQFVEVATLLLSAIQGLGRLAEKDHTPEIKSEADRAIWALNTLISPTGPAADLSSGNQIEQRWYSPSLLGAFAMMALRDLSEQRWPRICDNCDKLFVTKAYQGRYCTDRCRYAAQKRRYRQRQKRQAKPNQ
jgi:hypothetical protein